MENTTDFKLSFEYLNESIHANVYRVVYPNGYSLYKINFKAARYWFLNSNKEWKIFGDFTLAPRLKKIIIRNIIKHQAHPFIG